MPTDSPQTGAPRNSLGRAWAKARGASPKRRLLLILGAVVLAVAVFVVVPGAIASRPQFLKRYSHLDVPYQTWSTSVHSQAACQNCHVSPKWTSQAAYRLRMVGEFYLSFVNPSRQPKLFDKPTNEACGSCHIDLRTVSPSGDLNIPHRAHVAVLKLKCVDCHNYLVHEKSPEGKHTPRMATCLKCHDGKTAKNGCSTCHTNKSLPENHQAADWIVIHPQMQKQIDCAKCHKWTENWCAQCHETRPRSHTKTWRTDHGRQVKIRRNCEACHDAAFCTRCHGEVPSLNFDPALQLVK